MWWRMSGRVSVGGRSMRLGMGGWMEMMGNKSGDGEVEVELKREGEGEGEGER